MTSISKLGTAGILSAAILLLGTGNRCYTQATVPPPPVDEHLIVSTVPSPAVTPVTVTADQPGNCCSPRSIAVRFPAGWHVAVSPYLWFPGIHGTVGAFGPRRQRAMHARRSTVEFSV